MVASRYAAVFPIAAAVNTIRRARNRRRTSRRGASGGQIADSQLSEELPREYQIMLFWAGLRGAVGFALSAGIEGQNAVALQTTVLVAVVLTVVVFGGTTAQMLKILGIRTGVQDDEGDSSDEDEDTTRMRLRSVGGSGGRRRNGKKNRWNGGEDNTPLTYADEDDEEEPTRNSSRSRRSNGAQFSIEDLEEEEDSRRSSESSEALPSSSTNPLSTNSSPSSNKPSFSANDFAAAKSGSASARQLLDRAGLIMRDGQWFQKIDERYLLPMFSNSVASRKHEARKIARKEGLASQLDLNENVKEESEGKLDASEIGDDSKWNEIERDADTKDDEDESSDFFHLGGNGNSEGSGSSKRKTPNASRKNSQDRDRPNLSGAFSP